MAQTLGELAAQVRMELRESFSSPGTGAYVAAFEELVHIMLYAPYEQSRHTRLAELMTILQAAPESLLEVANRFLKQSIIAVELDGSIAIATGVATKYSKFTFAGQVVPQDAVQGLDVNRTGRLELRIELLRPEHRDVPNAECAPEERPVSLDEAQDAEHRD